LVKKPSGSAFLEFEPIFKSVADRNYSLSPLSNIQGREDKRGYDVPRKLDRRIR
jgi:hypothetical protein